MGTTKHCSHHLTTEQKHIGKCHGCINVGDRSQCGGCCRWPGNVRQACTYDAYRTKEEEIHDRAHARAWGVGVKDNGQICIQRKYSHYTNREKRTLKIQVCNNCGRPKVRVVADPADLTKLEYKCPHCELSRKGWREMM